MKLGNGVTAIWISNPHQPFRAGATQVPGLLTLNYTMFQSSPTLPGRCNRRSSMSAWRLLPCFNPHQPFRAGATLMGWSASSPLTLFQSSPTLPGRCNGRSCQTSPRTPCFNPHRPFRAGATPPLPPSLPILRVSILTDPSGPVQHSWPSRFQAIERSFNPHRPFRAGATIPALLAYIEQLEFQSSPTLPGRCNAR